MTNSSAHGDTIQIGGLTIRCDTTMPPNAMRLEKPMNTPTKPMHTPTLVQLSSGGLYYGPTPSGRMLDIQSDAVPAGVVARAADCYNACSSIPGDPAEALSKARRVIAMALRLTKELHDSPKSFQANMIEGMGDMREALAALGGGQ